MSRGVIDTLILRFMTHSSNAKDILVDLHTTSKGKSVVERLNIWDKYNYEMRMSKHYADAIKYLEENKKD